jgi:XdhC Rossmann domain
MGSRHAQLERRQRLLAAGASEAELARITAPVGLDLGALSAEETALSIMAEIVAVRHGRSGRRLSGHQARGDLAAATEPKLVALDTIHEREYSRAAQTDRAHAYSAPSSQLAGAGRERTR